MAINNNKLEMITVIDEHGCVISVEFIHHSGSGDKITIIRKGSEES